MDAKPKKPKRERPRPRVPDANALHEMALAALSRRALTRADLERALARGIANAAQRCRRAGEDAEAIARDVERAREAIQSLVERMVGNGLINDVSFAAMRAQRLTRQGRSRRAISAHLASHGVEEAVVREAVPADAHNELRAALELARRKRLGPFAGEPKPNVEPRVLRQKALATLARAGFEFDTAERVLRVAREEAEEVLRSGRDF